GSDSNCQEALDRGIEIISPVMGATPAEGEITIADFTINEKEEITACPAGHVPQQVKIKLGSSLPLAFMLISYYLFISYLATTLSFSGNNLYLVS
ncbi:MAG: hypothetical protein Q8R88_07740, partial [Desulfoprunum sp.]|nr:hypothetical protein [Desulfoprunum sp.]